MLKDLWHIAFITLEDKGEADTINQYKKEYLERYSFIPLIVANLKK